MSTAPGSSITSPTRGTSGSLADPDATAAVANPCCGDRLRLYARVGDGRVAGCTFLAYGCAPTIALGSLLTEAARGPGRSTTWPGSTRTGWRAWPAASPRASGIVADWGGTPSRPSSQQLPFHAPRKEARR